MEQHTHSLLQSSIELTLTNQNEIALIFLIWYNATLNMFLDQNSSFWIKINPFSTKIYKFLAEICLLFADSFKYANSDGNNSP